MSRLGQATVLWLGFLLAACSDDTGPANDDQLQCDCVRDTYYEGYFERTFPDGAECLNVGIGGCECVASECINVCIFDVCQSAQCAGDADCVMLGGGAECETYIDSRFGDLGRWCNPSPSCPKGTSGCPCLADGACYSGAEGIDVACEGGVCVANDTCPSGCRAGSVCCGGALCAGDCIGTPCC